MKNIPTPIKFEIFIVLLIFVSAFNISAQESQQKNLYSNDSYKVAFQLPEDSAKQSESTKERTVYAGEKSKFGLGSRLEFIINETEAAGQLSQFLSTDEGMEAIASALIKKLKGNNTNFQLDVLEKKRVQLAGLNGIKVAFTTVEPNKKIRSTMYVVPVPEQKRMYTFIIAALDSDFDKWFLVAEVSVNSFELSKSEGK